MRNLLAIFQAFTEWPRSLRAHFTGMRYGDLKKQVAEAVVAALEPFQQRYREITAEPGYVAGVLEDGAGRVAPLARETVHKVKKPWGFSRRPSRFGRSGWLSNLERKKGRGAKR